MRIISKTLLLLTIIALLPTFSIADDYVPLTKYKGYLEEHTQKALFAARKVDKWDSAMTKLGTKYESNKAAIARGEVMTVASVFGVTVTAFATGGQSVAWASIISAVVNASMTEQEKLAAKKVIGGMSLLGAYESAINNKKSALNALDGYIAQYNMTHLAYKQILEAHDTWDTHEGLGSQAEIHDLITWIDDWEYDSSLPSFTCGGKCGQSFNTPTSDHWVRCGYAIETIRQEVKRRFGSSALPRSTMKVVNERRANPGRGCGVYYYNCQDEDDHVIRYCQKKRKYYNDSGTQIITETCGDAYRKCLRHLTPSKGVHTGGSSSSASLSPSGGSYTASAGATHTANVSVPSGYQYVYWYIAGPGIDGLGLLQETDSGYGTSTTASFSWSIPSYASGNHVITAYTYLSDNSIVQPSYTVSVGSGSSTDTTDTTTTDTTTSTDTSSTTDDDDDDDTDSDSDTDDDSGTSQSNSLYATNGSYTLSAGDTHNATCTTHSPYSYVAWSVDGFLWETDSSYGTDTEASFSYTFDAPGTYTIEVEIQIFNGSYSRESYTVTVQ